MRRTIFVMKYSSNAIALSITSICLPNNKILDKTKLKAFTDEKLNIIKITISLLTHYQMTKF